MAADSVTNASQWSGFARPASTAAPLDGMRCRWERDGRIVVHYYINGEYLGAFEEQPWLSPEPVVFLRAIAPPKNLIVEGEDGATTWVRRRAADVGVILRDETGRTYQPR